MSEPKSPRKPVVMRPVYTDLVDPNEAPRAAHNVVNFNRVGTDDDRVCLHCETRHGTQGGYG